jgi:perosamine synthetase
VRREEKLKKTMLPEKESKPFGGLLPAEYWEHSIRDVAASALGVTLSRAEEDGLLLPGIGDCIPIRSARAGMVTSLQALGLPKKARVGVPLYSCPVVFKAVKAAGFEITFIDIDPNSYCMSVEDLAKKRMMVDAVIPIHMFGNLCDMPRIMEAAGGRPVIEDCAQSIGSSIGGRCAGTFGNVGVFSFRLGKYLSIGEGGALYVKDQALRSRILESVERMQPIPLGAEFKHIGESYLRALLRSRPLYGLLGYGLWNKYNSRVEYTDKTPIVMGKMFKSDVIVMKRRLKGLDGAIQRQRENSHYYSSLLEVAPCKITDEEKDTFINRYLYVISFPSSRHRDHAAMSLFKQQIGTLKPYGDIAQVAYRHYGYKGDCPSAEKAADTLLAVPVHHGLRRSDITRIARNVNEAWVDAQRTLNIEDPIPEKKLGS